MVQTMKCWCCGREFLTTSIFPTRCEGCQDNIAYTSNGIKGTRHEPCDYFKKRTAVLVNVGTLGVDASGATQGRSRNERMVSVQEIPQVGAGAWRIGGKQRTGSA